MPNNTEVCCPKCNSNQLTANERGFSGTKALGGLLLIGGIGTLAGMIGSNDIIITCLACGNKFKPGKGKIKSTGHHRSSIDFASQDPLKMTPEEYKIYSSEFHNWRDNYFKAYETKDFLKMDLLLDEIPDLKVKYKFKDITDVETLWNNDKDEKYYENIYQSLKNNSTLEMSTTFNLVVALIFIGIFFLLVKACS